MNATFALSSYMPGRIELSIMLLRVEQARTKYPLSIADLDTSNAKT